MKDFVTSLDNDNSKSLQDESHDGLEPEIKIQLSDDYYEAYVTIDYTNSTVNLTKDRLIDILKSSNILYGINHNAIDDIIKSKINVSNLLIARGKRHLNGTDGKIEYFVNKELTLKPEELLDGNVDHKNLNFVQSVKKGDILAKTIPPTSGEDGITVTGKNIKAKPGKPVRLLAGKNTLLSNDGDVTYLLADSAGHIKYENEKISILKVLEINTDIGISTGNISFNGKIIINGNVNMGYKIESEDDIEINGIVEGAHLISGGNIIIKQGIQNKSYLSASKNVYSKFIENCQVVADADVICDVILHSSIESQGSIIANDKKGLIIGGSLKGKKEVIAKTIGSEIGTITTIELGIDNNFINNINKIRDSIIELKGNIDKLTQAINILDKQIQTDSTNSKLIDILDKTNKTKIQHSSQLVELEEKLIKMNEYIKLSKFCKVSASIFYPGVKVKINNCHYNIKNIFKSSTLTIEDGDIRVGNYT